MLCVQELLALQLIRAFGDIFREAGLPLWVRSYEVLVTSNRCGQVHGVERVQQGLATQAAARRRACCIRSASVQT